MLRFAVLRSRLVHGITVLSMLALAAPVVGRPFTGCALEAHELELGTLLRWMEARSGLDLEVDLDVALDCLTDELSTGPGCEAALRRLAETNGLVAEPLDETRWRIRLRHDAAGGQCSRVVTIPDAFAATIEFDPPTQSLAEGLEGLRAADLIVRLEALVDPTLELELAGPLTASEALERMASRANLLITWHARGAVLHDRGLSARHRFAGFPPRFEAIGLEDSDIAFPAFEDERLDAAARTLSESLGLRIGLEDGEQRRVRIRHRPSDAPAPDQLERLALANGLTWRRQGQAILLRVADAWDAHPRPLVAVESTPPGFPPLRTMSRTLIRAVGGPSLIVSLDLPPAETPLLSELETLRPSVLVGVGERAAEWTSAADVPVVALGVTRRRWFRRHQGPGRHSCGVLLEPGPETLVDELVRAFPDVHAVHLVLSGGRSESDPEGIEQRLREADIQPLWLYVATKNDLSRALGPDPSAADLLWLMRADGLVSRLSDAAAAAFVEASTQRGLPVLGSTPRHFRLGATASFVVAPETIGRLGAELVRRLRNGETERELGFLAPSEIGILWNAEAGDELGLRLSSEGAARVLR